MKALIIICNLSVSIMLVSAFIKLQGLEWSGFAKGALSYIVVVAFVGLFFSLGVHISYLAASALLAYMITNKRFNKNGRFRMDKPK